MKTYPEDPIEAMRTCWSEHIAGAYHFEDTDKPTPAPEPTEDPEGLI